jgi:hypothetical protein
MTWPLDRKAPTPPAPAAPAEAERDCPNELHYRRGGPQDVHCPTCGESWKHRGKAEPAVGESATAASVETGPTYPCGDCRAPIPVYLMDATLGICDDCHGRRVAATPAPVPEQQAVEVCACGHVQGEHGWARCALCDDCDGYAPAPAPVGESERAAQERFDRAVQQIVDAELALSGGAGRLDDNEWSERVEDVEAAQQREMDEAYEAAVTRMDQAANAVGALRFTARARLRAALRSEARLTTENARLSRWAEDSLTQLRKVEQENATLRERVELLRKDVRSVLADYRGVKEEAATLRERVRGLEECLEQHHAFQRDPDYIHSDLARRTEAALSPTGDRS